MFTELSKLSLSNFNIPSHLEPSGLDRSDGKRPDGVTIVPWKHGQCLVWDATCPDTFAASYFARSTSGSGLVAELAESKKISKYGYLEHSHIFCPVAIETSGVCGPQSITFLKELGKRIKLK